MNVRADAYALVVVLLWALASLLVFGLHGWAWGVGFALVSAAVLWWEWRYLTGDRD